MDPETLANTIGYDAAEELISKFMKGQKEHGGDFAVKPTVENIREEVLDLISYSHGLRKHRDELILEVQELIDNIYLFNIGGIKNRLEVIQHKIKNL